MNTHNVTTYHCITCGRVLHVELGAKPPRCCGHTMTKAFSETNQDGDVAGGKSGGRSETARPVIKGRKKPR